MTGRQIEGDVLLGGWGVSIKEYYTIEEVSRLLHVHVTRIRELADQADDPMPFRCFEGQRRNGSSTARTWWHGSTGTRCSGGTRGP